MTAPLPSSHFDALGTTISVLVTDPAALTVARRAVEHEVAAIDLACSRFRDDSELAELNRAAGAWVPASPLFLDAVEVALRAAQLTNGLVDPTVGSTIRVLGYDRSFAELSADGPPLRVTVRPAPGWHTVEVDRERSAVRMHRDAELDLGATAKALCADRAATAASAACAASRSCGTATGVLVSLGGDIAVAGPPPGDGWSVRVTDDHRAPTDAPGQTVLLDAGGLATSGTAVRRWARGGRPLHHVVDPATGWPADTCWRTVSVAAGCCVDANIASTAAIVLGARAEAWLAEQGLPARLVDTEGNVQTVGGWPAEEAQCLQ